MRLSKPTHPRQRRAAVDTRAIGQENNREWSGQGTLNPWPNILLTFGDRGHTYALQFSTVPKPVEERLT